MNTNPPFNPFCRPAEPVKPQKIITETKEIHRCQIFDGEELQFEPGKQYQLDINYGTDNHEYFLVEFEEVTKENPNYDAEMETYKAQWATVHEWDRQKAEYDAQKERDDKEKRRAQYEQLRKEFGN